MLASFLAACRRDRMRLLAGELGERGFQESLGREAAFRRAWGERRLVGEFGERGCLLESLGREAACRRAWGERRLVGELGERGCLCVYHRCF